MLYHVGLKKGATILINGYPEYTLQDYWTSLKGEQGWNDHYVRYLTKANLMKQIAKYMYGNIRLWKRIEIDSVDLIVEREE